MRLTTQTFARTVLTPSDAAALVAGGCGCEDGPESFQTFSVETGPLGQVTWSGVIGTEGELTGDGRLIELNALRWEELPVSFRYAPADLGGHGGAQKVGRIMTVERLENGDLWGTGDIDIASQSGPEAARLLKEGYGVSMDLDDVSFEIRVAKELLGMGEEEELEREMSEDDEGRVTVVEINSDDEVMVMTGGRVRGATMVDIPAFIRASVRLDDPEIDLEAAAAAAGPAQEPVLVASGGIPLEPPAAWFANPNLDGPTPLTITGDGRIYGHLAIWGTCHTAYSGQCVEPPHSPSDYAYFRTGAVLCADGTQMPSGRITLDTLHAGRTLSAAETLAHYENTGRQAADVSAGEDIHGIWVAGAIRPGMSPEKLRTLRASPLSGDWRRIGGSLELVAALAVNSPGFPIPRPQGLVASGGVMVSLVASGMIAPDDVRPAETLSAEDVAYLKAMANRERLALKSKADDLASRIRKQRADALARRVKV